MIATRSRRPGTRLTWTAAMISEAIGQARFPFASADRIAAAQDRRVAATASYAYSHVPYYRETMRRLLLGPGDIVQATDLQRLPLLERDAVRADPEYFCSKRWPPERCLLLHSGGTTGVPLTIFRDPPSLLLESAQRERLRSIIARCAGRRLRYREASIRPVDSSVVSAADTLRRNSVFPTSLRVERRAFSTFQSPSELLEELAVFRPDVVSGYGSYLDVLLLEICEHGWPGVLPGVFTYSADGVSDQVKDLAKRTLGVTLLGSYNAIETPEIAFECDHHRGYHQNADLCVLRLIGEDGDEVTDGFEGQAVVSNLVGRGTVLLNYRLGDLAVRLGESCPCGRRLPLMSYLGRDKTAWLRFADGVEIHVQAVRGALSSEREIYRYQIVQEDRRSLRIRLVAAADCDQTGTEARIAALLQERLPRQVNVRVEFVSDLARGAGQKVQPVVPVDWA